MSKFICSFWPNGKSDIFGPLDDLLSTSEVLGRARAELMCSISSLNLVVINHEIKKQNFGLWYWLWSMSHVHTISCRTNEYLIAYRRVNVWLNQSSTVALESTLCCLVILAIVVIDLSKWEAIGLRCLNS